MGDTSGSTLTTIDSMDYVKLVGPFPAWAKELRKSGTKRLDRDVSPGPTSVNREEEMTGYSSLAQRGAAELLGYQSPKYDFERVRGLVEAGHDYWYNKMCTMRKQPPATIQYLQDELESHFNNVARPSGAPWLNLFTSSSIHLSILQRVLSHNITQYIYWLEMQDALNRIDPSVVNEIDGSETKKPAADVEKELEWIRRVARMSEEEASLNVRLLYAGVAGKEHLTASMIKPTSGSENSIKDIRFTLKRSVPEMEQTNPFDAAAASLFLRSDEVDMTYGSSIYTRFLAFEQACNAEPRLAEKYPFSMQLSLGEYALSLNLLSDLPGSSTTAGESSTAVGPRTLAVRLNVAQTAINEICTMLPDPNVFFDPDPQQVVDRCEALWDALKAISTILLDRFEIPAELRSKVLPFFEDQEDVPRWLPIVNGVRAEPNIPTGSGLGRPGMIITGRGDYYDEQDWKRMKFVKKRRWTVSSREYGLWKKMFGQDEDDWVVLDDVFKMFRSIDFRAEHTGGSFVVFSPPESAGLPWILRAPHPKTWHEGEIWKMPVGYIGHNLTQIYDWDLSWFVDRGD